MVFFVSSAATHFDIILCTLYTWSNIIISSKIHTIVMTYGNVRYNKKLLSRISWWLLLIQIKPEIKLFLFCIQLYNISLVMLIFNLESTQILQYKINNLERLYYYKLYTNYTNMKLLSIQTIIIIYDCEFPTILYYTIPH